MEAWAGELARRYGDRVDEWYTLNEPMNYLIAAYGVGNFPPGRFFLFDMEERFLPIVRRYFDLHARLYAVLKREDTVDADGDGLPAVVGLGLSLHEWLPARDGHVSSHPDDLAARERLQYVMQNGPVRFLTEGGFDADLDGVLEEDHPTWRKTLDWLGVQTYFRSGVTGKQAYIPLLDVAFCFGEYAEFAMGSCLSPEDPSYEIPSMGYAWGARSLERVLVDLHAQFPNLPLVVTESGVATESGGRRSQILVRSLEQIKRAQLAGADVRGYYHWTLVDNFEWSYGFGPRFGLYRTDFSNGERSPTGAVDVYRAITDSRRLTEKLLEQWGGVGPLDPEP